MPRTSSLSGLGELLDKQLSVVSRGQLLSLGMKDNAMRYRLRPGGPWQALLPGVYLGASGVPSLPQKEMAALLYAGPGSVVTGPMALMHHSIRSGSVAEDVIDVLVPAERRRLTTGFVRVHRTARMPVKAAWSGPVRLALVPRAVADTVRLHTDLREVRAVVADAVQLGRCTIGQLAEELRDGPMQGSAALRSVLSEVADGIRSTTEGDLRNLIGTARLPMPLFNPSLYKGDVFLGKPDAWWPDAGVAGEVDSRAWHLSPEDWDRTRRRQTVMAAAGIIVVHFSPRELRREAPLVVQRIRDALNSGLARPPIPIRTVPASRPIRPLDPGQYGRNAGFGGHRASAARRDRGGRARRTGADRGGAGRGTRRAARRGAAGRAWVSPGLGRGSFLLRLGGGRR